MAATGRITRGRRVAAGSVAVAPLGLLERPGDYLGPVAQTDGRPYVYFLLPIAGDTDTEPGARSVHCVASPPHVFRECVDGSLEVRESIGAYGSTDHHIWHGYLDEGHCWREI